MAEKMLAGVLVKINDEGYMEDASQWNKDIAHEIAKEIGIDLTDKHFDLLNYLRKQHAAEVTLTIRRVGKSGVVANIKELYTLFPKGPLKFSSKIAGIPKPASCV